jgi:hypothetical protein
VKSPVHFVAAKQNGNLQKQEFTGNAAQKIVLKGLGNANEALDFSRHTARA